jgi:hypothetical protein
MKARELEPKIIKELLDETTPEEWKRLDKEMSNQTAIDLIIKHIDEVIYMWKQPDMEMDFEHTLLTLKKFCKDKKEEEKQQIIDACKKGYGSTAIFRDKLAEQYYNETYGGNNGK